MASLLAALFVLTQVPGGLSLDPRLSWYTLETDHFSVHFSALGRPEPSLALAREVAAICEEVRSTLTPVTGWAPRERTQIILADFFDYFNGWAAPFPANTITILTSPPGGNRTNLGNWLRELILHEYSHIVQMDRVAGATAGLRRVFGSVVKPNALAPAWLNEGYAVYNETRFTNMGRLRSAEYDMMARAAADSGRLLPVDRCGNYELRRFPSGNAPYLYGAWLHAFAARTDSNCWERYNRSRSASLPFFENLHARQTLGRSVTTLWAECESALAVRAGSQTWSRTALRPLTREGFWTGSPLWSRQGGRLFYVSATGREHPAIKALDLATDNTYVFHRGLVSGSLSLSLDGTRLAFSELRVEDDCYELTDLYSLDLVTGQVRRLTNGLRARDPDYAPDTSLIVFVSTRQGQNNLNLLDPGTGAVTPLTETDDRTAYHGPRFSPSGKWIAVGVARPGGYSDVELVDRNTGWTIPVTHDRANDLTPTWSKTGKHLFFISDRTGVYNLFAYQLATGATFQVTDVPYGVFDPAVSPDNRLIALTNFSAQGYDLAVTELKAEDWKPAPDFIDSLPTSEPQDARADAQLYYYSPFPSVWPRFWLPWVSLNAGYELGAFTLGWDALQFHTYSAAAGYRKDARSPFLRAGYELRRYRPILEGTIDLDFGTQTARLGANLPWHWTRSALNSSLGLGLVRDTSARSRLDAGLSWTNAHQYRFNVAPVEGRTLGLSADACARALLSDKDRVRLLGCYVEYLGNPPQDWSLRARLALASAFGDRSADEAWQLEDKPGLLGVRGYSRPSSPARTVLAAGLQFRTPLAWVERGLSTAPLFLSNLNAAAFTDAGLTSDLPYAANSDAAAVRIGVGAELRADLILAHVLPVNVNAGVGFGLIPLWSFRPYFGISSSILEGLLGSPPIIRLDR